MVTVECKECPIRNFCAVYQLEEEDVPYHQCPFFLSVKGWAQFEVAEEELKRRNKNESKR